jgi:multidrug efflux pump subunit AcrB
MSSSVQPLALKKVFAGRNIALPGGQIELAEKNFAIDPSGEFKSESEIGGVMIGASPNGSPQYLRDVFEITRVYQNPARYLNLYSRRSYTGAWQRTRAITLAVSMRNDAQVADFGGQIDAALSNIRPFLPDDLEIARTSDQPLQVRENVNLFTRCLWEAIVLVVIIALIGFWEWRSAVLMALSIPLTLAMTLGMMECLGVDIQQVSIAALIIAIGLIVDDPVVAGDAIKREIAAGHAAQIAAWLGPTKLATAIVFATLTNILAYLPLLILKDEVEIFIYTLPIVLTCALLASRIVSMTFVPLLGNYLLRPRRQRENDDRIKWIAGAYRRLSTICIVHRKKVLLFASTTLILGGFLMTRLNRSFFPKDHSYLSYVDIWLPKDASLDATAIAASQADKIIHDVAQNWGRLHPDKHGKPREVLDSLTTFVGGGGPRFWFSLIPEFQQLNYAQIVIRVNDKHDTGQLVGMLQERLTAQMSGALVDVRELETAMPVGIPIAFRFTGEKIGILREIAEKAKQILRQHPQAERVRDDWGSDSFTVKLKIDSDKANLLGLTNIDVALSSIAGTYGLPVTRLREGSKQIPVIVRLSPGERSNVDELKNLYVYPAHDLRLSQNPPRIPLRQVSTLTYAMETAKIKRRNYYRTITVSAFPAPGMLPSQIMDKVRSKFHALNRSLPPGYTMEIGGEEEEQNKGFIQLSQVMAISIILIFLALTLEFKSAIKPLIVFAAVPFGMIAALAALAIMGAPIGFMAFLGIASLIGVIVSHLIILFDCIEEMQVQQKTLGEALIEAGIVRLRPIVITVGSTVIGLFPLALKGGHSGSLYVLRKDRRSTSGDGSDPLARASLIINFCLRFAHYSLE